MSRMRSPTFHRQSQARALAATCIAILITSFFALSLVPWVAAPRAHADTSVLPAGDDYGAGLSLSDVSELEQVVASPDRYEGDTVLLRGRISEVCQRRGCWAVLSVGETNLKVNMKDHAFFIPSDCSGRQAYVEGMLEFEASTAEAASDPMQHSAGSERCGNESKKGETTHMCGDDGSGHGPRGVLSLTANGVRLLAAD